MKPSSLFARAQTLLEDRRLPWWLAAFAVLLVSPALGTGLVVDDYVLRAIVLGGPPGTLPPPLDAFRFIDGSNVALLRDLGVVPWFASPGLKLAFLRPLASASHWLDFTLYPDTPLLMHAVSLAWLAATVYLAALLYRRLLGAGWVAGLAALFFALDPGHALAAGWISGRNSVMAAFFGLLAVYAHDRWRRDGERAAGLLAPLACAASLACGESGLATLALLAAHALTFEGPGLAPRVRALAPAVALGLAWALVYRLHGCGAAHSAMYQDPIASPVDFLRAAALNFPINLGARFGGSPAAITLLTAAWVWPLLAAGGLLFAVFMATALWPVLRARPEARFLALSALLAGIPIAGTLPADRNLFFLGFASFGLVGLLVARAAELRTVPLRLYAGYLLFLLCTAVPLAPANAIGMRPFELASRDPLSRVLLDDAVRGQTVVFVNPASPFFVSHLRSMRLGTALPIPARVLALFPGLYGGRVVRSRADQLTVHVDGGMLPPAGTWPASADRPRAMRIEYTGQHLSAFVRGPREPLRAGELLALPGCVVEVKAATEEGGPTDVTFTFDRALEDGGLRFLAWEGEGYVPFALPRVGEGVEMKPVVMAVR